jgi:ketosteroid isomerase-like protein
MERVAVIDELFARIGRGAYGALEELFTEDVVQAVPYHPVMSEARLVGRERVADFIAKAFELRFKQIRFEVVAVHPAREAGLYFVEYRSEGTMRANDAPYRNKYIAIFRIREGKIAYWKEYYDPSQIAKALAEPFPQLREFSRYFEAGDAGRG